MNCKVLACSSGGGGSVSDMTRIKPTISGVEEILDEGQFSRFRHIELNRRLGSKIPYI